MNYQGVLTKMKTENADTVQYFLDLETDFLHLNQLLGSKITIRFIGYQCLGCGGDKKIFRQGYCYDCFYTLPQTADWIIKPELSKAHLGIEDRNLDYEKSVQLQPHIVYLANTSAVKVGVTRKSQIPTRWIDQGAHEAIEIVEVPNRYLAGITEQHLKDHISDKTNWRKMLKNEIKDENLISWREKLKPFIPDEARSYFMDTNKETHIVFPVLQYPVNPKPLNLDKIPVYTGVLSGIKGQYLIFNDDTVFNIRSNEGTVVDISIL